MTRVGWTPEAKRDRFKQLTYVAVHDPGAAARLGDLIMTSISRLADYPASGRPGRVTGTRELVIARTPYVAIYRLAPSGAEVLRILHGGRNGRQTKRPAASLLLVCSGTLV